MRIQSAFQVDNLWCLFFKDYSEGVIGLNRYNEISIEFAFFSDTNLVVA